MDTKENDDYENKTHTHKHRKRKREKSEEVELKEGGLWRMVRHDASMAYIVIFFKFRCYSSIFLKIKKNSGRIYLLFITFRTAKSSLV